MVAKIMRRLLSEYSSGVSHLSKCPEKHGHSGLFNFLILLIILMVTLLISSCPTENISQEYKSGNIIVQILDAHEYNGKQFICYVFNEDNSVTDLSGALGCGLFPGTIYNGRAEVEICEINNSENSFTFTGGRRYLVYGFIDADGNGSISEGDSASRPDFTVLIDGETIVTFYYPSDFALVRPEPGARIEITRGDVLLQPGVVCLFGSVVIDSLNLFTFTISNPGDEPLNLTGGLDLVNISGTDKDYFLVVEDPETVISAYGSTQFTVEFSPLTISSRSADISIDHNGLEESPFFFSLNGVGIIPTARIPVTGITSSQSAGDDGDIQWGVTWPATRFNNNSDGTLTDALTGLMWQQTPSTATRTWENTLTYVDTVATAGHTDWRLPNVNELSSLLNANTYDSESWLEGFGFINIQEDYYWSSTTFAPDNDYAWGVDFGPGSMGTGCIQDLRKTGEPRPIIGGLILFRAWCVRSSGGGVVALAQTGQTTSYTPGDDSDLQYGVDWPAIRFVNNGNGTITDALTGLMWEQSPIGSIVTWNTAVAGAANCSKAGYTDWRLPNRSELRSLCNYGQTNSVNWLNGKDFNSIYSFYYWTSTPYPAGTDHAWIIFMTQCQVLLEYKVPSSQFWKPAWYVRGGG